MQIYVVGSSVNRVPLSRSLPSPSALPRTLSSLDPSISAPEILLPRIPMARFLPARTLTLARLSVARPALRLRASRALSGKVDYIEIDLSEESPSSSSGGGGEGDPTAVQVRAGMRRLEDAIHGVLVRRAAPDWLPFVPGASYWVPPMPRPLGVADLLSGSVYAARGAAPMTEEEALSFTTVQGWPSAEYFVEGKSLHTVKRSRKDATQTDDEES